MKSPGASPILNLLLAVGRMSVCPRRCRGQWLQKLKLIGKPRQRSGSHPVSPPHIDHTPIDHTSSLQVIAAEGEQRAALKLREAADVMDESPATLQLRYLQTLNTISAENNHTYVFPLPLDLLRQLFMK